MKKTVKAWAVTGFCDDRYMQTFSSKKLALEFAGIVMAHPRPKVVPCTITYDLPKKRAKK